MLFSSISYLQEIIYYYFLGIILYTCVYLFEMGEVNGGYFFQNQRMSVVPLLVRYLQISNSYAVT